MSNICRVGRSNPTVGCGVVKAGLQKTNEEEEAKELNNSSKDYILI